MGVVADRVVVELEAKLDRYNANVLAAERQWTRSTQSIAASTARAERQVTGSLNSIKSTLLASAGAFAGLAGLNAVKNLADGYTRYTNQLKLAGNEGAQLTQVQNNLFAVAQKYGVQLEGVGTLYSRVSQAGKELGASQLDVMKFTTGVAAALKVQGGAASESRGAMLQLSQMLGAPIVQAQEFNSVLDGARPIIQAVANGIDKYGGSIAKLRSDVIQGKVSSQEFFQGFLRGSGQLEQQAARANLTIGASFEILNNALGKYVGETDHALSLTSRLSLGIRALADNLDTVVPALAAIAAGYVGVRAGRLAFDAVSAATARALQIDQSLATAILKGNVSYVSRRGLIAANAAAAASAAQAEVTAIETTIAARTAEMAEIEAQIAAERALILERENAARAAAVSLTQGGLDGRTGAMAAQAAANNDIAAAQDRLTAARARATAVNIELTAAETGLAAAEGRAAIAAEAEAAAVTADTLAKRVGAATTALFAGTLTTLGAALPFLAIAALTAAVIAYSTSAGQAAFDSRKFQQEGDSLSGSLLQLHTYANAAAGGIAHVGGTASVATGQVRQFAGAVGDAAQQLYNLAVQQRQQLAQSLINSRTQAEQEAEAARSRYYSRQMSPTAQARFGDLRSEADKRAQEQDRRIYQAAIARRTAAQRGLEQMVDLRRQKGDSAFLTPQQREAGQNNGRNVTEEAARVERDLTIARERGNRAVIDSLQAQQFEIKQYKKYRKDGLSPEAAQEASNRDKSAFQQASAGAQGDRNAKAGAAVSKREAAAQRAAARHAAAAERDAAGDTARYTSMERRAGDEIASARADLAGSAEQRAKIEKDRIETERQDRNEELRQAEKQGQLGTGDQAHTRMLELQRLNDERAALESQVVDLHERQRLAAAARDVQTANLQNEQDLLKAQEPLATTQAQRQEIALRLLDLQYEQERIELGAITVANGRTDTEEKIAKARLRQLDAIQSADRENTKRQTEGVGASYLRGLRAADVNEQLDQIKVNGLRSLDDAITNTIANVFKLGGAFGSVVDGIIRDLIRIGVQRAIIEPLANSLFGPAQGTTPPPGGSKGGFLSSLISSAATIFGGKTTPTRASGGHVIAGKLYQVNETGGGVEGFRPSQSGQIVPLGRMNRADEGSGGTGAPAIVRLVVGASEYFDLRVQSISGSVAVETVRLAAPSLTDLAVAETFRQASRPEL